MGSSPALPEFAHLGVKACGCFGFIGGDTPELAADNARDSYWLLQRGGTVERLPLAEAKARVKALPSICHRCEKPEPAKGSTVERGAILPGQFFATNGTVFRRANSGEGFDFGGQLGRCIRVHRQKLDGRCVPDGDAEWMRVNGARVRLFEDWEEAADHLEAKAARQGAEG